jgi:hypothetical protein
VQQKCNKHEIVNKYLPHCNSFDVFADNKQSADRKLEEEEEAKYKAAQEAEE